jgi:hypothetical protein
MRRLSKLAWFAVASHIAAVGCIVVVLVNWGSGGIEGAYFSRSVGDPAVVSSITPFDPVPWLAAGLALLVAGTAAFVTATRRR